MAGDWIMVRHDLADDPAVARIASDLDVSIDDALGKCVRAFSWFDRHTTDGRAARTNAQQFSKIIGHCDFAVTLENVGWLRAIDGGIMLVHFKRWNGKSAKHRALAAKRQAKSRENSRHASVTLSSRSARNESATREQQRREEKSLSAAVEKETPSAPEKPGDAQRLLLDAGCDEAFAAKAVGVGVRAALVRSSVAAMAQADPPVVEPGAWLRKRFRAGGYAV